MAKYKVGGITTAAGITFVGQKAKVTIRNDDGSFIVKKWNNPSTNKYAEIPFIRGFYKIFAAMKMAFGTWIGKLAVFFMAVSLISMIIGFFLHEPVPTTQQVNSMSNMIFAISNVIILLGIVGYTLFIRNLHGLEHKIITTYNKGLPLTVDNVKAQRKETPQCGGTLLGIILLIDLIWVGLLSMPTTFIWILFPSIGYEAFLIARDNKWYSKILYFPGWLIQQITTGSHVKDSTVEKYLVGFRAFIVQEDSK